jgi:hypothetical protein
VVLVLTFLSAALAQEAIAGSDAEGRVMRPLTYPANPDLTRGSLDNFFKVYVDPNAMATTLKPKQVLRDATTETLSLYNRTTGWQEVTVDGTKIGLIGPLTTAAIHGIPAGEYVIKMTNSAGYTSTMPVATTTGLPERLSPGNEDARVALEDGYVRPGFSQSFLGQGVPVGYTLPAPLTPAAGEDAQ